MKDTKANIKDVKTDSKLEKVSNENAKLSDKDLDKVAGGTIQHGQAAFDAELAKDGDAGKLAKVGGLG